MRINPFIIYLWGIADQLRQSIWVLFAIAGVCACICVAVIISEESKKPAMWAWRAWKSIIVAAITWSVAAFFPSSKTIALMVVVPAIINSEPIQKDLPEMYQMAKDALKETLKTK